MPFPLPGDLPDPGMELGYPGIKHGSPAVQADTLPIEPPGKSLKTPSIYTESASHCRVRLFVTPQTVARQDPLCMGFFREECWSGMPFPPPGDLPDSGIEPGSPTLQADSLTSEPPRNTFSSVQSLSHV